METTRGDDHNQVINDTFSVECGHFIALCVLSCGISEMSPPPPLPESEPPNNNMMSPVLRHVQAPPTTWYDTCDNSNSYGQFCLYSHAKMGYCFGCSSKQFCVILCIIGGFGYMHVVIFQDNHIVVLIITVVISIVIL